MDLISLSCKSKWANPMKGKMIPTDLSFPSCGELELTVDLCLLRAEFASNNVLIKKKSLLVIMSISNNCLRCYWKGV